MSKYTEDGAPVVRSFHLRIDIKGALKRPDRELDGFLVKDGEELSAEQCRAHMRAMLQRGVRYLSSVSEEECPNFDPYEEGCPGHER